MILDVWMSVLYNVYISNNVLSFDYLDSHWCHKHDKSIVSETKSRTIKSLLARIRNVNSDFTVLD